MYIAIVQGGKLKSSVPLAPLAAFVPLAPRPAPHSKSNTFTGVAQDARNEWNGLGAGRMYRTTCSVHSFAPLVPLAQLKPQSLNAEPEALLYRSRTVITNITPLGSLLQLLVPLAPLAPLAPSERNEWNR